MGDNTLNFLVDTWIYVLTYELWVYISFRVQNHACKQLDSEGLLCFAVTICVSVNSSGEKGSIFSLHVWTVTDSQHLFVTLRQQYLFHVLPFVGINKGQ